MTDSFRTGSIVRRAARMTWENLETRRMLSTSYELAQSIYDPASADFSAFGLTLATKGDLALVAAPDKNGNQGEVILVDTSTNSVVRTFSDPDASPADSFGSAVAFIGGSQIAISALVAGPTSSGKVWIYDDASDISPLEIASPFNSPTFFNGFGAGIADYNGNILISTMNTGVAANEGDFNGDITLYDSSNGDVIRSFNNYLGGTNDGLGGRMSVSGTTFIATAFDSNSGDGVVLQIDGETGDLIRDYNDPDGTNGSFGAAMALSGGSAFLSGINGVHQFDAGDGSFTQTFSNPDDPLLGPEMFGNSLAVGGGNIFIGAPGALEGEEFLNQGAGFVFNIGTGDLEARIANPTPMPESPENGQADQFGYAVGYTTDGGFVMSDPTDDSGGGIDTGGVYAFAVEDETPTNEAPDADVSSSLSTAVRLQGVDFTGSFTDPNAGDTHDVSWDFDDGNTIAFHSSTDAGALTPTHAYTATGVYDVTFTVRDNGLLTDSATVQVTVAAVAVEGNDLWVGGTNGNDVIDVRNAAQQTQLKVTINGVDQGQFIASGKIFVLGGDGNDDLNVATGVQRDADIFGGSGADTITGGGGDDFLYGGADGDDVRSRGSNDVALGEGGNDLVTGGDGRDFLIGGTGSDTVRGNADDDILVASFTDHDNDRTALTAIQAEWTSVRSYSTRIANITDGSGSVDRVNGSYFLTADGTVHNDNAADTLAGGQGEDWFFLNLNAAGVRDRLQNPDGSEVASDLD